MNENASSRARKAPLRVVTWNVNGLSALDAWLQRPDSVLLEAARGGAPASSGSLVIQPGETTASSPHSLTALLHWFNASIICLQETKLSRIPHEFALVDGFDAYFACCRDARRFGGGYAGVVTYCRRDDRVASPVDAWEGVVPEPVPEDMLREFSVKRLREINAEGRCVITDHDRFVLFNLYFPTAGGGDPVRTAFKHDFNRVFQLRMEGFQKQGRHVVVVGDINATYLSMDRADVPPEIMRQFMRSRSKAMASSATQSSMRSFTESPGAGEDGEDESGVEELVESPSATAWLRDLVSDGDEFPLALVDTFRKLHPHRTDAFTCWHTKLRLRESNLGSRIDHVLVSRGLRDHVVEADIMPRVLGSDHCPVFATLAPACLNPEPPEHPPPPLCARVSASFAGKQTKLGKFFVPGARRSLSERAAAAASSASSSSSSSSRSTKRKRKRTTIASFFKPKQSPSSKTNPQPPTPPPIPPALARSMSAPAIPVDPAASEASAAAWGALLNGKPDVPNCPGHDKPCASFVAKKKGKNLGRRFYTCAEPPATRCKFFRWASARKKHKGSS